MNIAGLIYGNALHHIDHIAPLCAFLEVPVIVTEPDLVQIIEKFYPSVVCSLFSQIELPQKMIEQFDVVISSMTKELIELIFFFVEKISGKRMLSFWCPHGNSDKGLLAPFMEALKGEEGVLYYGEKMLDFIKSKNAYDDKHHYIPIGNYREAYYRKMQPFYDELVERQIRKRLNPSRKTILYAPTWKDSENSSSLLTAAPILIDKIPSEYNLIVKLHPNEELTRGFEIARLMHFFEHRDQVLFLRNFPPIYPLLNQVDIYVGDHSSISYDFLAFDKPMFFLNPKSTPIEACGHPIQEIETLYDTIKTELENNSSELRARKKALYEYTFSPFNPQRLKQSLFDAAKHIASERI